MDLSLPSDDTLRFLVSRYARLRASFGAVLADAELIEPSGKHFPDAFALEPEAIARLFKRTMSYAPLSDGVAFELGFIQPEDEGAGGGGCGSGACAPGEGSKKVVSGAVFEREEGGYAVPLRVQDVGDPVVLTASIARAVGAMVLFEADERAQGEDFGVLSEIAAVSTGLGVLLLNGACVYKKGCSGLRAHQATHLDVAELAVLNALFCRVHGAKPGVVRGHLPTTQTEAFAEALAWVDTQDEILEKLRTTPELLADGVFEWEKPKGFFGRLFGGKKSKESDAMPPLSMKAAPAKVRSEAEMRRLAEMRALVEDAFDGQ